MGLFNSLKQGKLRYLYLALRRRYLIWLRRDYLKESISLRKGSCQMCPCCYTRGLFRKSGRCKYLDGNKCTIYYTSIPPACKFYPIDEKDKTPFSKEHCAYYWDKSDIEKLKKKYKFIP